MKKTLLTFMALLTIAGSAMAQSNALSVADIELPQNSEAALAVSFQLDAADTYTGYSFNLELPEELEFVMDEGTDVAYTKGSCHDASHSVTANLDEGLVKVAGLSLSSKPLVGISGVLLTFTIKPKSAVTVGQTFTGSIKDILIVPIEGAKKNLFESSFTITIGEPVDTRTILDETSTIEPEVATDVNVRVKRTIKANQWSTICLPFAMTAEQVVAVFGNDVELADFDSYEYDETEDVISVKFTDVTAMEANHPYIIKVSQAIEEFTVDGVDVEPTTEPSKGYYTTGKKPKLIGKFVGTYVADFDFYNEADNYPLFLSDNKFYYATENTKHMKAFRGYFDFEDNISEAEGAAARIQMVFDESGATGISTVAHETNEDRYYNLSGQRVENLKKGLYIKNNKKVVVK